MVSTSCRASSSEVTTPKFPLPPRSAQNRSSLSYSLAVRMRPAAATTSAFRKRSRSRAGRQRGKGGERPVAQPGRFHRDGRLDGPPGRPGTTVRVADEGAQLGVDPEELGEQVALPGACRGGQG